LLFAGEFLQVFLVEKVVEMLKFLALAVLVACALAEEEPEKRCGWTPTTASGRHAPAQICAGQLIFEDNFDFLDHTKWEHEVNSDGGGVSFKTQG
jgi:hypothetical protein